MFGWLNHGRNNDNHGFSRTSRGNGVSAKGNQGEGDLLNKKYSKSSCIQELKIMDDEDESKYEDEDDEFYSVKPMGHKQPMLIPTEKEY